MARNGWECSIVFFVLDLSHLLFSSSSDFRHGSWCAFCRWLYWGRWQFWPCDSWVRVAAGRMGHLTTNPMLQLLLLLLLFTLPCPQAKTTPVPWRGLTLQRSKSPLQSPSRTTRRRLLQHRIPKIYITFPVVYQPFHPHCHCFWFFSLVYIW